MDNKFTIEYKLKVDGDNIKGKAAADAGGDKIEFDIEGKREKADRVSAAQGPELTSGGLDARRSPSRRCIVPRDLRLLVRATHYASAQGSQWASSPPLVVILISSNECLALALAAA